MVEGGNGRYRAVTDCRIPAHYSVLSRKEARLSAKCGRETSQEWLDAWNVEGIVGGVCDYRTREEACRRIARSAKHGTTTPATGASMTGRFTRQLVAMAWLTGLTACAHGNQSNGVPNDSPGTAGSADSLTDVRQMTSDHLVTAWMLRSDPPQRPTGLRITFTIDSASGSRLYGELSHFFSGNVGTDPREFEPFIGSARAGRIAFAFARRGRPDAGVSLVGHFARDTIFCDTLVLGPDTLTGRGHRWFLIREHR